MWKTSVSTDYRSIAILLENKTKLNTTKNILLTWYEKLKELSGVWVDEKILILVSKRAILNLSYELQSLAGTSVGEKSQEEGVHFLLFLNEIKLPGYSSEGKTQHVYEWTCLLMTILGPEFLALKKQCLEFSISGKREKRYYLKIKTNSVILLSSKVVQILCSSEAPLFRSKSKSQRCSKSAMSDRIIEWLGSKGTWRSSSSKPLAMGRDISH